MGQREGGSTSQGMSVSDVLTPHAAPPLPQVVAIDLDEGLNGLVSYRMPVGMPRMDFLINSSSGVVVTTAELDRERIAEYQLRVVASDAGAPTKSSTSTLTIRGEGAGVPPAALSTWHGPWGSGSSWEPTLTTAVPCPGGTGHLADGRPLQLEPFDTAEPSLSPLSQKCRQGLLPTWSLPSGSQSPGAVVWTHC